MRSRQRDPVIKGRDLRPLRTVLHRATVPQVPDAAGHTLRGLRAEIRLTDETASSDALLIAIKSDQVRAGHRLHTELAQQRDHLSSMVGSVIHQMLKGLRERLRLADAVSRVLDGLIDASLAESFEDSSKRGFMRIPCFAYRSEIGKVLGVG